MEKMPKTIAFPKDIGCGLAGGHWPHYEEMILDFATDNPECQVTIVTWLKGQPKSLKSNKFYGVVKGHVPGIYTTWDEAKAQVHGYKDAMYKSFKTEAEAKEYMNTPPPNDRIYLDVPYQEKDVVKSQDARWDPGKKKWWVRDITPELEKYVCVK